MTVSSKGADAVLPRGLAGPGLPWIDTVGPTPPGARELETLGTGLPWLAARGPPLPALAPGGEPGTSREPIQLQKAPGRLALTVAWAREDLGGSRVASALKRDE